MRKLIIAGLLLQTVSCGKNEPPVPPPPGPTPEPGEIFVMDTEFYNVKATVKNVSFAQTKTVTGYVLQNLEGKKQ